MSENEATRSKRAKWQIPKHSQAEQGGRPQSPFSVMQADVQQQCAEHAVHRSRSVRGSRGACGHEQRITSCKECYRARSGESPRESEADRTRKNVADHD